MKKVVGLLITLVMVLSPALLFGQAIITIGSGTATNGPNNYPAPYGNFFFGAKHQMVILASELNAQGMTVAGDLNSLAFNVAAPNGVQLDDFTIALKNTTSTSVGNTFETGVTTVHGPADYTETTGWNTHNFSSPFYWDGTSNILVEVCFNNGAWTQNAQTFYTSTSFNSVGYYRADAMGVCGTTNPVTTSSNRPNMRFVYTPNNVPPITNFTVNTQSTCSGNVFFTDLSQFTPTSWQWTFGDGGTSTQQNPSYTYLTSGTYDVTLISCNAFGCDTLIQTSYITVNLAGGAPIAAFCAPMTTAWCCGFGITNFTFASINSTTSDGSAGYEDLTCLQATLTSGSNYTATISTPGPQTHNAAMWIDYNNDGIFDDVSERVLTSSSDVVHSALITIPGTAVQNTPLRLRISADYDLQSPPTPCLDPMQGQAEDYTVIIQTNTSPPTPDFTWSDTLTCDGTVSFTDMSYNLPTAWFWDFGDAITSNQQNPTHTYTADGVYDVSLTVSNGFGNNQIVMTGLINVTLSNATTSPSCTPSTLANCCGYGITQVICNTIDHISADGSEGYQDFSCSESTSLQEGVTYNLFVRTGQNSPQDTRAWIDFNDDGVFDNTTESIMNALNQYNPSQSFTVPGGAVLNTPLRMRVMSDIVGVTTLPCSDQDRGQTEDYSVVLTPNLSPPNAFFNVDSIIGCGAEFVFTDASTQGPTTWSWDFGDASGTSTLQNPVYSYASIGTYTVVLTITNNNGTDTYSRTITYDPGACQVYNMPSFGQQTINSCSGTLYDDGGPNNNYNDFTNGTFVIEPPNAVSVTLNFIQWDFVQTQAGDFLHIFDGNNIGAPSLGSFTGNTSPGTITSSGGSITLQQETDFNINDPGFELVWTCSTSNSIDEVDPNATLELFPNPANEMVTLVYNCSQYCNNANITIQSTTGQVVYEQNVVSANGFRKNIELSTFAPGIYFVAIGTNNNQIIKKLIVQ